MKDAAKRSQRASRVAPTRREIRTFRVCTTQDFDSPPTPKRKPGPYTLACEMCRTRKIKCLESHTELEAAQDGRSAGNGGTLGGSRPPCQACVEANTACHWEVEDGRKRQRRRTSDRPRRQALGAMTETREGEVPEQVREQRAEPEAALPSIRNLQSDTNGEQQPSPLAAATAGVPVPRNGVVHIPPELASIFETEAGSHDLSPAQPFIAEFYPHESMALETGLEDWPDFQNLILDFSGAGGGDGIMPTNDLADSITNTTHQAYCQPSAGAVASPRQPKASFESNTTSSHHAQQLANRPRLIRIRYYRRFGPTAVVPGFRKLSVVVDSQQEEEGRHTPEVSSTRPSDGHETETAVGSASVIGSAVLGDGAATGCSPTASISAGGVAVGMVSAADAATSTSTWDSSSPGGSIGSNGSRSKHLFFDSSAPGMPRADVIPPILDTFFAHFGGHFPFHQPQILGGHVRSGEASSFLLNAIAALTLRFCSAQQEEPASGALSALLQMSDVARPDDESPHYHPPRHVWQRGQVYLKKAKKQLMPLLSIPAPEVVAGLVVLAWAEFGDNNEAGLWMFAGMAIRMAQDLGFHRLPETATGLSSDVFHDQARPTLDGRFVLTDEQSAIHQQKARLVMFWSVLILDVCVSLGTGRPPSIRPSEVEVGVPTYADMKKAQLDFSEPVALGNMIFPATARFMLLFSEAVEALNERGGTGTTDTGGGTLDDDRRGGRLAQILDTMLQRYRALPAQLVFTIDNYRGAAATGQAGLFLILHLFFYTFVILLSEKILPRTRSETGDAGPTDPGIQDRPGRDQRPVNVSVCCQKVVQAVTIALLVDPKGVLATPFINHALFVVASAIQQDSGSAASQLPTSADFEFLCQTLREQGRYFPAINAVLTVLEQREKETHGDCAERAEARHTFTHEEGRSEDIERVVGVYDPGIVHRYAIPE
ncbi:Transcription factor [Niveomyces insectorum RCEF 264]|uniref:Transcription factor n=1 Tax=Niveomyces insectorum RCEF 264 TaxID=1081102 RepID=A0A167MNZ8_9HYPO|nr:Transcription factor [Niveomyces insectorum RCEF 264]